MERRRERREKGSLYIYQMARDRARDRGDFENSPDYIITRVVIINRGNISRFIAILKLLGLIIPSSCYNNQALYAWNTSLLSK
jgi:hypothetical protein